MPAECQLGFDSPLDGCEPDLLETLDRDLGERLRCEVGEGRSAPEVERILEEARPGPGIPGVQRSARLLRTALETLKVELLRSEPDDVPRCARLDC